VKAIAELFPGARVLVGSDASEQQLDELAASGELSTFTVLHLATHAEVDWDFASRSALLLAQDRLPDPLRRALAGQKVYDGKLDVGEILSGWKLNADLVTLSACQTGQGKNEGGEGLMGFTQALFLAGARSCVLSLWPADDQATALLMQRFYQNLLGKRDGLRGPLPKAEALREAKAWLHDLTGEQAAEQVARLPRLERGGERARPKVAADEAHPYAHPYYWSAFILIGDPD
jgi:CHAT domain-containing protein